MLFEDIVFGPIKSRRLGDSLGLNVLPTQRKLCNFNCVYCECGWNPDSQVIPKDYLHSKEEIISQLEQSLKKFRDKNQNIDSITFAGNGEPTIHPEFPEIVDEVIILRDKFYPNAKITVLSNSTRLVDDGVFNALKKIDNPILKLDSANKEMFYRISKTNPNNVNFDKIIQRLIEFGSRAIIQTLLIRGKHNGEIIDNTTKEEFEKWLEIIKQIKPLYVMLYPIDRVTPESELEKLSKEEIQSFADILIENGINAKAY